MSLSKEQTPLEKYYDHKCDLIIQNQKLSIRKNLNFNLDYNMFSFKDRKSMKCFLDSLHPVPFKDEAKYNYSIHFNFNHPNVLPVEMDKTYQRYPIYLFEDNLDILLSYKENIVDDIFYEYLMNLKIFEDEPDFLQNKICV
jgi:hypothetical protein